MLKRDGFLHGSEDVRLASVVVLDRDGDAGTVREVADHLRGLDDLVPGLLPREALGDVPRPGASENNDFGPEFPGSFQGEARVLRKGPDVEGRAGDSLFRGKEVIAGLAAEARGLQPLAEGLVGFRLKGSDVPKRKFDVIEADGGAFFDDVDADRVL